MPQQVRKTLVISICLALAVSALLVFWQVRNFDFVNYDDNDYVYENPHVLNGLTAGDVSWAFTTGHTGNWHPLTWLSLMLDRQLSLPRGPSPAGFHLTNLFFHIANTLLLFLVLKQMTNAIWQSAFVAALFALHPMHVESVAWIAERKDVLSTFFWLLAMLAYVRYVKQPNAARYLLVLIIFALGLMAKPMLVTLPFVFLLLDYWPLNRIKHFDPQDTLRRRQIIYRLVFEKIPFFALVAVSSIVTFLVMRSSGAVVKIDTFPLNSRIANAVLSYVRYLYKMVWPQNLAAFYPLNAAASFPFWQVAMCVLLLLVISFLVVRLGRSQRYLPIGWFWFVGTLVPVIGIIQVGLQGYADRYTYVSYIGLFIMIAWGLPALLSKWISASPHRKIALGLSMIIVLTALGICAHRQTSYWKDSVDLFSHAIEVTQNNYIAHYDRGVAYSGLGRWPEAMEDFKQTIKINPAYVKAYNNLSIIYVNLSRYNEAIETLKQVIRIKPDGANAYYNLGNAYCAIGRWPEAIEAFSQAVRIKPDLADAHYNLGNACCAIGRWPQAIEAYKQAIKLRPDLAEAHHNLGCAYLAIGDKNSAMAEYNILKSLNSQFADKLLSQINK
jgi:Flp pilus assembly protein TadD